MSKEASYRLETRIKYFEAGKVAVTSCAWKKGFRESDFVKCHLDIIIVRKESRYKYQTGTGMACWHCETYNSVGSPSQGPFQVLAIAL